MTESRDCNMDDVTKGMEELTVLSFRKVDDVRRLARHFRNVIDHPRTQERPLVLRYLRNLDDTHRRIFLASRECVEVEYIFTTEKKSSLQRQRFNSLPVSEVPELLKSELQTAGSARQVHICTDCNVEIDLNDEEPLMESLQKHFNLDVHLPKLKRESVDVAEPILLPNMSRRLSAMECGEPSAQNIEQIIQLVKPTERIDRMFASRLETSLIRHLPDGTEASVDTAIKFYQTAYDKLCQDVSAMDFTTQTSSVAPIIMSIKDNVNQNFAAEANKNFENDENDQTVEKPAKNQTKKYRHYGHIEGIILKFLEHHKLLSLVDDRTGKLAFFCMACEFYTLRFRYDSVLNHVFGQTHIHNLATILTVDKHIPLAMEEATCDRLKNLNRQFLFYHGVTADLDGLACSTCKQTIDSPDLTVNHILDENHLARLSDKYYRKMKANNPDAQAPEKWGPKSLDWGKFLASVGKPLNNRDHVVIENFIKPSGKIANYCTCCDMTLKGLRQVLFNHIRQKKHLRNAAPYKLSMLYKNHCRPAEYYASFGNYYVCAICPQHVAAPSFAAIVDHIESGQHVDTIAKLVRAALHPDAGDGELLERNGITTNGAIRCDRCDVAFEDAREAVRHVLTVEHQSRAVDARTGANRGDIISVYMGGNYVLHSDGAVFTCVVCSGVFSSIRSLLAHLVFANHFAQRPSPENVFRFYLELKHNVNMLARNKYDYYDFGRLKCGVCDADVEEGENAKRHVVSVRHRENMGASYVNVSMDASAVE